MRALVLLTLCAALPPWSYADDSGCLQTYTNYAAMWVTMKGTGIDTGHPSGKIQSGETCAKLGYTEKADTLKVLKRLLCSASLARWRPTGGLGQWAHGKQVDGASLGPSRRHKLLRQLWRRLLLPLFFAQDLPAVFRALYVDVTAWQKPQAICFFLR